MIELGIILLVIGAVVAIACHFGSVPVGIRIGLIVVALGALLIIFGALFPGGLSGLGDDVDEPDRVGMGSHEFA